MYKWIACITILFCSARSSYAQLSYTDKVQNYIEQYKTLAIAEQKRSGIPASITLGQGILETEAGCSELVTGANNHFGIKCKKTWTGETFAHTDDAPNECFRKYRCADDSYKDHSDYLQSGTRYASLFTLSPTDYASWAVGLRRCGYATNPRYAQQLIKIIEDFKLQQYTYMAMGGIGGMDYAATPQKKVSPAASNVVKATAIIDTATIDKVQLTQTMAEDVPVNSKQYGKLTKVNGLKAIYVRKGELLLSYAMKNGIHYPHLLEMNDLTDAPLYADMYIYLEKKNIKGPHATHTMQEGETLHSISQAKGIQLKKLLFYNRLKENDMPVVGSVLQLQQVTMVAPTLVAQLDNPVEVKHKSAIQVKYNGDYNDIAKKAATAPPTETTAATTAPAAPANMTIEAPAPTIITNAVMTTPVETTSAPAPTTTNEPPVTTHVMATQELVSTITDPPAKEATTTNTPPSRATVVEPITDAGKARDLDALKAMLDKAVYSNEQPQPAAATTTEATPAPQPVVQSAPVENNAAQYYVVKKGDTAFSIAKRNNLTMRQLMDMNNLNFEQIKVGQRLRVQ